jgi:predicted transcriptional regulator of viral defense system
MTKTQKAIELVQKAGIARTKEFEKHGISRTDLQRLKERGVVERVGRGLYTLPSAVLTERHSLAEATRRVPGGVICLLTALRFHELTTQNPFQVWIAIDQKAWRPKGKGVKLRIVHLSGRSFSEGIEEHDVAGVTVRIYSAAKTVADCFKFRNKVGLDVAVEALREYRKSHRKELGELWRFAEANRVARVIRPYIEAIG